MDLFFSPNFREALLLVLLIELPVDYRFPRDTEKVLKAEVPCQCFYFHEVLLTVKRICMGVIVHHLDEENVAVKSAVVGDNIIESYEE